MVEGIVVIREASPPASTSALNVEVRLPMLVGKSDHGGQPGAPAKGSNTRLAAHPAGRPDPGAWKGGAEYAAVTDIAEATTQAVNGETGMMTGDLVCAAHRLKAVIPEARRPVTASSPGA
jgi:hypothetical protein